MNRGIDLEREAQEQKGDEWQFGAASQPCIAAIPESEREKYLPIGQLQFGLEDFMSCATIGPINILEAKFTWLLDLL